MLADTIIDTILFWSNNGSRSPNLGNH